MTGPHPRHRMDDLLAHPVRLSIVAALRSTDKLEFAFLRDLVEVSDSVLSKQVSALEAAGYVAVQKGHVGRRPRTWLKVTAAGQTALADHLGALQEIARSTSSVGP